MDEKATRGREAVLREFEALSLGDKRLNERGRIIVGAIAASPALSFPRQESTIAGREALYRFLSNRKVTMEKLLEGHIGETVKRMVGRPVVRLLHDSSSFKFSGDREGLGVVLGNIMGFIGHFTLAVAADETREPLGIVAVSPFIHADAIAHRGLGMRKRKAISKAKPRAEKESSRWDRQALATADLIPAGTRAIHVMDQEADDFLVLAELARAGADFVIRVSPKRKTTDGNRTRAVLANKPSTVFRSVQLSTRPKSLRGSMSKNRLPRIERNAQLEIRWGAVSIPRSERSDFELEEISVNAVHVFEPSPPAGEQPIEWMLLTSEAVTSLEDASAVVDHYRARWVIEEYFKALKSGCAFEKRQLTSYEGLTRALALFVPVAWHLLTLRHLARADAPQRAGDIFDREQLLLLASLMKQHRYTLPEAPTVRDAMLGLAALGGHIRNNGEPGWQVLGRGYLRFVEAEVGWRLARGCDQS